MNKPLLHINFGRLRLASHKFNLDYQKEASFFNGIITLKCSTFSHTHLCAFYASPLAPHSDIYHSCPFGAPTPHFSHFTLPFSHSPLRYPFLS